MEQEKKVDKAKWQSSKMPPEPGTSTEAPIVKRDTTGRGGTASVLAGVAVIAPVLIRELTKGSDPVLLLPVTLVLLAVALGGLRVAQSGKDGSAGRIGMLIAVAGCGLLTLMFLIAAYMDMVKNTRLQDDTMINLSFLVLVVGLLIFGWRSLVAGVLARGPVLLMMVSLPLGVLLDKAGAFTGNRRFPWGKGVVFGAGLHLGMKVFGLALIWLGYSILKTTKVKTEQKVA